MRFSLRTLLLMFPAFLLAWFLAAFIYQFTRGMSHPKWTKDKMKLSSLEAAGSGLRARTGQPLDVDKVNAWLAGKIAYGEPDFRELTYLLAPDRMNDKYDQPFRCVALDSDQKPLSERKTGIWLGFYSLGQDGKSSSHGLDPDDLNSWELEVHPHHREQSNIRHLLNILRLVPFTLAGVLLMGWIWFGRKQQYVVAKEQ